jgi:hypothetical protein
MVYDDMGDLQNRERRTVPIKSVEVSDPISKHLIGKMETCACFLETKGSGEATHRLLQLLYQCRAQKPPVRGA